MAGKESEEEVDEGASNAWMVTFSDLLTLMITFFVLLLTMSSMDTKSVKNMFGILTEASGVLEMGSHREVGRPHVTAIVDALAVEFVLEKNILSKILEELVQGEDGHTFDELKGDIDLESMVSLTKKGLVVTMVDSILFEPGETELNDEAARVLDLLGTYLLAREYLIHIEGHSGMSSPIERDSGWIISAKRANSVMRYLTDVVGVKQERIFARGYAEFSPLYGNGNEEDIKKNRRVEIVLSKKKKKRS